MKPILIVAPALLIAWLFAGRQLSLLLDHIVTARVESLPVTPIAYDGGFLSLGGRILSDLKLNNDSANRPILSADGKSFTPVLDSGDEVALTVDRSWLSWPTPFETNFMTGHTTSWRRNRYYRLIWKKRSGATLEARWRYEQWRYPAFGWTGADMT